jgi:hypothetical protein
MNCKKTFSASAETNRSLIVLVILLLLSSAWSPDLLAQKKKKGSKNEKAAVETPGRLSISKEPDFPGASWPEWFLNPPPVPHGIGVCPFWKSDSMRSYFEGRTLAIQDLNASDRLIVTVETAISEQFPYLLAQEFAIDERFNTANAVGIDSMVIDNRLYYLVAALPVQVERKKISTIPSKPEWVDKPGTEPADDHFAVGGQYKIFMYTKQNSWIKAKQDALAQLSQYMSLSVKTNQKVFQESYSQTIYVKSRIYLQDVLVTRRWSDGTNYFMQLHVLKNNIKSLD